MIAYVDMVPNYFHFSFFLGGVGAIFYMKILRSCTDLVTCESELHGWISRMPCPILSHMGTVTAKLSSGESLWDSQPGVSAKHCQWVSCFKVHWRRTRWRTVTALQSQWTPVSSGLALMALLHSMQAWVRQPLSRPLLQSLLFSSHCQSQWPGPNTRADSDGCLASESDLDSEAPNHKTTEK